MKGVVVIGHGSKSKDVCDIFFKVVEGLRKRINMQVEGCFMEISNPDITSIIDVMYEKGIKDIVVLPYFLFTGTHIKKSIPEILEGIKEKYSEINISIAKPIEYHDLLIEILADRVSELLQVK